jgi:CTP:molybdopterin cytidylyltransferase MocA
MALLAPHICSPAASRPAVIVNTHHNKFQLHQLPIGRQQTSARAAQGAAAAAAAAAAQAAAEPVWQVYTGKMPLVGFENIAAVLKYVQPAQQLLELHTYTLLQGPDQVTNSSATHHQACCRLVSPLAD